MSYIYYLNITQYYAYYANLRNILIKTLFKAIIIKVAKGLIETSIYPTQDEFKNETKRVVEQSHPQFYKSFRKSQWVVFYEKSIYQRVSLKQTMNDYITC